MFYCIQVLTLSSNQFCIKNANKMDDITSIVAKKINLMGGY